VSKNIVFLIQNRCLRLLKCVELYLFFIICNNCALAESAASPEVFGVTVCVTQVSVFLNPKPLFVLSPVIAFKLASKLGSYALSPVSPVNVSQVNNVHESKSMPVISVVPVHRNILAKVDG